MATTTSSSSGKSNLFSSFGRAGLTLIGFVLFGWYLWRQRDNIGESVDHLGRLAAGPLVLCLALEVAYYVCNAHATRYALAAVGWQARWRDLFPIGLESIYLNTIIPSAGLAGTGPLWEYAAATKQSGRRATAGYILTTSLEVIAVVWFGLWSETSAQFGWWPFVLVGGFILGLSVSRLFRPIGAAFFWAAAANLCEALILGLLAAALGYPLSANETAALYVIIMLTWYLSPTPQGLGAVELVASSSLAAQQLPAEAALALPLIYRAFVHWLPALGGFVLFSKPARRRAN